MRVKVYIGDKKPMFQLGLPVGSKVEELSKEIQEAISNLGILREAGESDLMGDLYSQNQIKQHGACLWKIAVQFKEILTGRER